MEIGIYLERLGTPELIAMIIVGVLALFFGYRIKKVAFFIVWFIIGLNLTTNILPWLNGLVPQIAGNELWQNLLPIAGGLLLALMGFTIEKVCVGGIVFALTLMITAQYFGTEPQTLAIGAVVGIILAGAAVMLVKPAIIIATAIAGGCVVTLGILKWTGLDHDMLYFPLLIGISVLGAVVQFATTRRL